MATVYDQSISEDARPRRRGRLSALSVFLSKSVFYGAFVWARRALNRRKRRFPARAVHKYLAGQRHMFAAIEAHLEGACATGPLCARRAARAARGRLP
jgi:hypothetical protein